MPALWAALLWHRVGSHWTWKERLSGRSTAAPLRAFPPRAVLCALGISPALRPPAALSGLPVGPRSLVSESHIPLFSPAPASITDPLLLPPFPSSVDSELTSLCQSVLEDFNLCLFYLPSSPNLSLASEEDEEPESGYAFLPDLLIFQMVLICLMGVHSLKRAGTSPRCLSAPPGFWKPRYCGPAGCGHE